MQNEKIVEKARHLYKEKQYKRSFLLFKTLCSRNVSDYISEYAISHMNMEMETLGYTTHHSTTLFRKGMKELMNEPRVKLQQQYNLCLSKLREEDKIEPLPLIETFSNIYPASLVKFIQKECKKLDKFSVSLPDHKRATFWFDMNDTPRFALEEIVQQICKLDFPNESYKKHGIIGREWRSQVRQPNEDIVFHFDKDEGRATKDKIFKFPYIGTVTYLTECGGPTMVFDHRTTERNNSYSPKKPKDGFISMPAIGKHIKFDGELFHGVMGAMNSVTKENTRITFLINYWQYKPIEPNCVLFPYDNKMNQFSEEQRDLFLNHVQSIKNDDIIPLCQDSSVEKHILPIIRGSQSFYIQFPKHIERNKTFSFTTDHEIPSGFLNVHKISDRDILVLFTLSYSEDWYWTVTVDKKTPIVLQKTISRKQIKCKRGKHKVTVKAFTMKNKEIANQMKQIHI